MSEKVIVRVKKNLEAEVWAPDIRDPESDDIKRIEKITGLTPYGMMMASVGTCTGILLHYYARDHHINLDEVEILLQYQRNFAKDSEQYGQIIEFDNRGFEQEIILSGDLTPGERDRLYLISRQCPVSRLLEEGVEVKSNLVAELE